MLEWLQSTSEINSNAKQKYIINSKEVTIYLLYRRYIIYCIPDGFL